MTQTSARSPVAVFAALGDTTRLRLVERMARRQPLSITQLVSGTEMTRQAVTKHLHVLAHAGLASPSRRGREQLWSLDQKHLDHAREYLDRISRQWDDALSRLKFFAET
ncbi:MAG TPA: metalloregulator ArsR/SmtB family transcription factor [Verrucomicrobiae bacterium]|nr:metalloregulator ArsR/SmtB family transcription factor [Verrucomicrobiae bacterium]